MRKLCLIISAMLCLLINTMAQDRTVTGKVTDDKGAGIPNATVLVKGTQTGTTTAADGSYSIVVPATGKQLEFSFLGSETSLVTIGSKTNISVSLVPAGSRELAEVVVTGINKVKRSQFAGASTKIDEKILKNIPVGSFDQVLQGRVPGVTLLTGSGAPGTASTVIIRGSSSILGGSAPFYVVDGIPVEEGTFQNFNPNDFASVDVLRDAAATSLYGSRASSGVIVITTKKGTSGKMKLGYSGQFGVKSRPDYAFRSMNTTELLKAQEDYGKIVGPTASTIVLPGYYYSPANPRYTTLTNAEKTSEAAIFDSIKKINTNWSDEIFKQGNFSNHQITLSGGSGKTTIYSSLGFYNEEGTTLRSDMNRITLNTNLNYSDDKLTYAISSNIGYTKRNFQQSADFNTSNPFATSVLAVPYHIAKTVDGKYATGTGTKFVGTNQLDQTFYDRNYNNQIKGTLGVVANYKITNNFSAGITAGADFRETQGSNYGSPLVYTRVTSTTPIGRAGFQLENLERFFTGNIRPTVGYKTLLKEKHDIDINAYGEYVKEIGKLNSGRGFITDPKRINTSAAIQQGNAVNQLYAIVNGRKAETSLFGALMTAKYSYNSKYTVTGSFRRDASSKLPKATRAQNFYSVGAIWEASKESFIQKISAINTLRLKVSYGSSGNANNFPLPDNDPTWYGGAYYYQATYSQGSYSGIPTIVATNPGNPRAKWETTYTSNLGLDFELLNRRLYGDLNLYSKTTKDLFVARTLSAAGGFNTNIPEGYKLNVNAGELSNKGFEWNVNGEVIRKKDLVVTIFANGGYNKNRVKDLGGESSFTQGTEQITVGLPLGSHFEVKWGGVDAATGQSLYYTKDGILTNAYSSNDAVQTHGTWEAPWRGGFGTSVNFKGFELSVLFSWQRGATKYDNLQFFVENPTGFMAAGYNQSSDLRFWQKPGDITNTPSPLSAVNFSSQFIHDASFMRFRNAKLAYTLPKSMFGNSKILSATTFYVQGQNLFLWTKWRGRDPEAGATNLNISEYPNPRSITAGLDITF